MIGNMLLSSLISGVFGVIIGWLFPIFLKKIRASREKRISAQVKELNLSGEWMSIFLEETDILNETVQIEQVGRNVTAILKLGKRHTYELSGEFRNHILVATYEEKESKRRDERGCIVLRLINENLLSGYCTFIYKNKQVYNSPYILVSASMHKPNIGTYHFCNTCVGKLNCCCNCETIDMPILLPFEIEKIATKNRLQPEEFSQKLTNNLSQMKRTDNDPSKGCYFFQNKKCSIYEDRPIDCRLFPFDFKEFDGEYWVIYYDQICSALPTDQDEIKMCAHSLRPLLELESPYLSECSDPVFSERLSTQHYHKLFPIQKIIDDKIDL